MSVPAATWPGRSGGSGAPRVRAAPAAAGRGMAFRCEFLSSGILQVLDPMDSTPFVFRPVDSSPAETIDRIIDKLGRMSDAGFVPIGEGHPARARSLGECIGQYDVVVGGDVFGYGERTASQEDWTLRSPALSSSYSACPGFVTSRADGALVAVGVAALVVDDWFKQHPALQSRDTTLSPDRENPISQQQDYVSGEVARMLGVHGRAAALVGELVYARHAPAGIEGISARQTIKALEKIKLGCSVEQLWDHTPSPVRDTGRPDAGRFDPSVRIHPSAAVAPDAVLGPGSVVAAGVSVGPGVRTGPSVVLLSGAAIERSVLAERVVVERGSTVSDSTLGADTVVGPRSRVDSSTVGPDCVLSPIFGKIAVERSALGSGVVADNVSIEGSTVGDGACVKSGARVVDSTLGARSSVGTLAKVTHSQVAAGAVVPSFGVVEDLSSRLPPVHRKPPCAGGDPAVAAPPPRGCGSSPPASSRLPDRAGPGVQR